MGAQHMPEARQRIRTVIMGVVVITAMLVTVLGILIVAVLGTVIVVLLGGRAVLGTVIVVVVVLGGRAVLVLARIRVLVAHGIQADRRAASPHLDMSRLHRRSVATGRPGGA